VERGTILVCPKGDAIYAQSDAADAIFFVQKGKVRLTVVSHAGKERTIGLVSEGSFWRKLAGGPGSPHRFRHGHDVLRAVDNAPSTALIRA
jgi:CRP-like cAMP-binding protein